MPRVDPTSFGAAVRTRRRAMHLSQDAIADAIGVNRRVIGELERGKGTVRLEIALAAANAVGLDIEMRARTIAL